MFCAPITRDRPTAFVVTFDNSASMADPVEFGGEAMTKSEAVGFIVGGFVDELLHRARREEGPRDYYDILVLGYGGTRVETLLDGRPSQLAALRRPVRQLSQERTLPSGRSIITVTEHRVWFEPRAEGGTPMCAALSEAARWVERWCRRHPDNYPPTVINITDGEASDGTPEEVARLLERLRAAGTSDGHALVINIHLVSPGELGAARNDAAGSVLFPLSADELPAGRYARLLWEGSSELPFRELSGAGSGVPARGIGFNCDFAALAAAMNIGSVNSVML